MNDFMVKAQIQLGRQFRYESEQQEVLEELLETSGENRLDLLRWEMREHVNGFVYPRSLAGLEFIKLAPEEGWEIVEQLIKSSNDDNRNTAREILQKLNAPRAYPLLKLLLADQYIYLQLAACDFLMDIYPKEVEETLKQLAADENKNVREAAQKRLDELNHRVKK
jgi:HEAT repeat protein